MSSRPVAALWRLRPYLRPYRFQLIAMIVAALAAEGAEVAIPLLVKVVIDGAIAHHERDLLIPFGIAAIALGVASAMLSLIRRWVQGNAVTDMEKTIRDDLYAHLERLDPAFHDECAAGLARDRSRIQVARPLWISLGIDDVRSRCDRDDDRRDLAWTGGARSQLSA